MERTPPASQQASQAQLSRSLVKGLAMLCHFTAEQPTMRASDFATQLGMATSSAHRYASTLAELGYLEQDSRRRYRIGLRAADIGMSAVAATGLTDQARPYLEELREATRTAVSLAVLHETDVLVLDRLHSHRSAQTELAMQIGPGSRLPAHCTAAGLLLLAHLPGAAQRQLLTDIELATNGPTTIRKLSAQLRRIHESGFAVYRHKDSPGITELAAPVRDHTHAVVAALDLQTISSEALVERLNPQLMSAAAQISAQLGYQAGQRSA